MSGAKFYIWGGGRWRELNTVSGEVAGWSRRARFVFARRGRLRVATRRRVLAALQAHTANLPSSVGLGPRLSVLSNEPVSASPVRAPQSVHSAQCGYHHCCIYSHGFHDNNFGKCNHNGVLTSNDCSIRNGATKGSPVSKGASITNGASVTNDTDASQRRCDASTRHRVTVDAAVQHTPKDHSTLTINLATTNYSGLKQIPQKHRSERDDNRQPAASGTRRINHSRAPPLDKLLRKHSRSTKRRRSVTSDSDDSERHFKRPSTTRRSEDGDRSPERPKETTSKTRGSGAGEGRKKRRSESISSDSAEEVCKELTISESDVLALRSFVARTRCDALARFDADDDYKRMLFYAINPLVDVERCAHTERALRERRALALPHFAARLGLAPARSSAGTDKENEASDSDAERELFENSRENKKSPRQNRVNLRKNIRELVPLQRKFENKLLENSKDKNRNSSSLGTHTKSNRNSRNFEAFKKPEILRQSANEFESNDRKCETSRHNTATRREPNTESSASANKLQALRKGRHENSASSVNKRKSLRHITVIHHKRDTDDSKSDEKHETLKKGENKASKSNKRESLRHTTVTQRKYITESSDSEGKSVKGASHGKKRESLRTRTVAQQQSNTEDSDSDDERETVTDGDSGRESAYNKRPTLRHKSKPDKKDTDSDNKFETSYSSTRNRRKSVLPLTKKYIEQSASEVDSALSLKKAVTPTKNSKRPAENGPRTRPSRTAESTADSEGTEVSKPAKLVKPSTKSDRNKTRQPPTLTDVDRVITEAGPTVTIATHTISKRASNGKMKEYSNLEDHAIVAWVSGGGRARKVNGNALWRELQDQYTRLTGVRRSWHSLRNRYLRYILPALGALRLPPADVSRLRAAAATGSMKRRGVVARRNSIFEQSAVRAASARHRPARTPTPTPTSKTVHTASYTDSEGASSPARRPTARDVTAARAPPRDAPDDEGGGTSGRRLRRSQISSGAKSPPAFSKRGRKLFNPKLVL